MTFWACRPACGSGEGLKGASETLGLTGDNLTKARTALRDQRFSNTKLGSIFGKDASQDGSRLYTLVVLGIKRVDKRVTAIAVYYNMEDVDSNLEFIGLFTVEDKPDFQALVDQLKLEKK
jgi:hypothetical protein